MKAITCSQCGAIIKGISSKKEFADCKYCGAEIPVRLEKIFEISDKSAAEPLKKFTNEEKQTLLRGFEDDSIPFVDENTETGLKMAAFAGAIVFLIVVSIGLAAMFTAKRKSSEIPETKQNTAPTIYQNPSNSFEFEFSTPMPEKFPDFSYRAYVKYFTDIGVEDAVVPVIEESKLPTMDLAVLKKTVFKQKRIKVRITINPDGEVIDAKPLNGHPVLQEFCVTAAKKSLFTTRKRNYTTDLTYIFVIED